MPPQDAGDRGSGDEVAQPRRIAVAELVRLVSAGAEELVAGCLLYTSDAADE